MRSLREGFLLLMAFQLVMGCGPWKQPLESMKPVTTLGNPGKLPDDTQVSDSKMAAFIQLAGRSETWRSRANRAYQNYETFQKPFDGKIAARNLIEIQEMGARYFHHIRRPLLDLLLSPYFHIDLQRDVRIQTQRESYIETGAVRYFDELGNAVAFDEDPVGGTTFEKMTANIYHINPTDRKGRVFLREFEVSFAAALLLMDNYDSGWAPYIENTVLRRNLFYDMHGTSDEIRNMVKAIHTNYRVYKNSGKWAAALDLYLNARQMGNPSTASPLAGQLERVIENSPTFKKLEKNPEGEGVFTRLAGKIKYLFRQSADGLSLIRDQTTFIFVKAFARTTKPFKYREGKLNDMAQGNFNKLARQLKPLDVLLEKNPASVVDKYVPGHYGHSAVWLGTESELKELGVWEELPRLYQEAVERFDYDGPPFHESVRRGQVIVDALHPGIELSSLRKFLDIDDLAVLRLKDCPPAGGPSGPCLTRENKRRYLLEALKQVGKNYDYNFDVNTNLEIVCSEVMYRTFVDMDFPTTKMLGKHTISPDQVASLADSAEDPFELVVMYHNGELISEEGNYRRKLFHLLVREEYSAVAEMTQKNTSYY